MNSTFDIQTSNVTIHHHSGCLSSPAFSEIWRAGKSGSNTLREKPTGTPFGGQGKVTWYALNSLLMEYQQLKIFTHHSIWDMRDHQQTLDVN